MHVKNVNNSDQRPLECCGSSTVSTQSPKLSGYFIPLTVRGLRGGRRKGQQDESDNEEDVVLKLLSLQGSSPPPSSAMLYVDQLQDNNPSDEFGEILPDRSDNF
jgi:hypothetical protein